MPENKTTNFVSHFTDLISRYKSLMTANNYDHIVIPAGMPIRQLFDDMDYPFKVNPQFKALLPLVDNPHCHIVISGEAKPLVIYYQPVDFWHVVPTAPTGDWVDCVSIQTIANPGDAIKHLPKTGRNVLLGEQKGVLEAVDFSAKNPESIVMPLNWQRAYKSEYEIDCIYRANVIAAKAHNAARDAFYDKGSELSINRAYLLAAGGSENDMPYTNITCLNEHCAILHYMVSDNQIPAHHHSFLIDAGAQVNGYASDITRTYSFDQDNEFADMIKAMDAMQLRLVDQMKHGASYVDLHKDAHRQLGQILQDFNIVDMPVSDMLEQGVTSVFFPHGLGHQIGLQVHDVGGHQTNEQGGITPPPAEHPFLRNTRQMEAGQVLTIEPGLYFIDTLLEPLKQQAFSDNINWQKIDELKKFGGIRIED
ncbi:MAG: Xaa-Pro dipeptidase, partial [Kangiellaceae bacterium]|nr:Xaa-Pro dipeptidase [Kangiellaceae bacterium]